MKKLMAILIAAFMVIGVVGCNEKEKIKAANIARTAMFVALGTGTPAIGVTPVTYDADSLFLPTAEALVRLAFAKDPAARAKVQDVANFVLDGISDSTFITLNDVQWAVLESMPDHANPLWVALVVSLRMELNKLAVDRGVDDTRINVNVKRLLEMVLRISRE